MKILIVHNHYLEKGGEDEVVDAELGLLKEHGHKVIFYKKSNEYIKNLSFFKKLFFIFFEMRFSKAVYKEIKEIIKNENPDIAHIHNTFICITPSIYHALKEEDIPIVQTLHNYRFFCLNGTFFNREEICEKCKDGRFLYAIIRKCWKNSSILSYFLSNAIHGLSRFLKNIDSFIALSKFSKNKFVEFGLEKEKIHLKANFLVNEPKYDNRDDNYALFVGRLTACKGIKTLIEAFKIDPSFNLKIIGDGPLRKEVSSFVSSHNNVCWLGKLDKSSVFAVISRSSFLIFPSQWHETMGMILLESFVLFKPVLASNLGAIREFVIDGINGILFEPGNAKDLAGKISYLFSHEKERMEMGKNAYKIYRERFDKEKNYSDLMEIYTATINSKNKNE